MKRELDLSLSFDLCSAPKASVSSSEPKRATRVSVSSKAEFDGLVIKKPDYERQYAPIYFSRLRQLRGVLDEAVRKSTAATSVPFREQLIRVQLQEECWVVGTVFREMTRPSALDAYNDTPVPVKDCYATPNDKIVIEDETGRAVLVDGGADLSEVVTGLVAALRCIEQQSGELLVKQIMFPGFAPLYKSPTPASPIAGCIGFVSGKLDGLAGEMLAEFLCGAMGAPRSLGASASVGRLIVLGNALGSSDAIRGADVKHHHQVLSAKDEANLLAPVARLDAYLARLCGTIPVDLLPGPLDPAAQCLPQQPLSSVLFAHASKWKSLNCVTNPYRCVLGGSQQLVACSGQPLDNLLRFSPITSRLEAACSTLRWRHVCPTAPDTLACYPAEEDPFVLTNSPHLLVFGNQPAFESRKVKETTVLLVPSFEHSKSLVLFNLSSGHVSSIKFTVVE